MGKKMVRKTASSFVISAILIAMSTGFQAAHSETTFIEEGFVNGIRYMTGGVGTEERAAMEQMAKDYDLELVFALATGEYLANVEVIIRESGGRIPLKAASDGPLFFVDLPQGLYEITASYKNQRKFRKVKVSEVSNTVFFHWRP
jgi:hypothetical protein